MIPQLVSTNMSDQIDIGRRPPTDNLGKSLLVTKSRDISKTRFRKVVFA